MSGWNYLVPGITRSSKGSPSPPPLFSKKVSLLTMTKCILSHRRVYGDLVVRIYMIKINCSVRVTREGWNKTTQDKLGRVYPYRSDSQCPKTTFLKVKFVLESSSNYRRLSLLTPPSSWTTDTLSSPRLHDFLPERIIRSSVIGSDFDCKGKEGVQIYNKDNLNDLSCTPVGACPFKGDYKHL